MKGLKRFLSLGLAVMMTVSLLPMTGVAADVSEKTEAVEEVLEELEVNVDASDYLNLTSEEEDAVKASNSYELGNGCTLLVGGQRLVEDGTVLKEGKLSKKSGVSWKTGGYVKYDAMTNTLTLRKATINGCHWTDADENPLGVMSILFIQGSGEPLNIVFDGTNTLSAKRGTGYKGFDATALFAVGDVVLSGKTSSSKLYVKAGKSSGPSMGLLSTGLCVEKGKVYASAYYGSSYNQGASVGENGLYVAKGASLSCTAGSSSKSSSTGILCSSAEIEGSLKGTAGSVNDLSLSSGIWITDTATFRGATITGVSKDVGVICSGERASVYDTKFTTTPRYMGTFDFYGLYGIKVSDYSSGKNAKLLTDSAKINTKRYQQFIPATVSIADGYYNAEGECIAPKVTVKLGSTTTKSFATSETETVIKEGYPIRVYGQNGTACTWGSKNYTYNILPGKVDVTSAKSPAKKTLQVTWTSANEEYMGGLEGYQVRYARSSSSLSKATPQDIEADQTEVTIENLTSGKYYYVQMRGMTDGVWSAWSTAKKVKVK